MFSFNEIAVQAMKAEREEDTLELLFEKFWSKPEYSEYDFANSKFKVVAQFWFTIGYGAGRGFTEDEK